MNKDERTRANVVPIRKGIYQLQGAKPGSHVYLIKGTDKNLLIDAGMASGFPTLEEQLNQVGLASQDIGLVVLTHEHVDHAGAAISFSKSAVIAAHHSAANKIELQDEFVILQKFLEWRAGALRVDVWLDEGNLIDLGNYRLRVVHTPGHCSGCICLYEPFERLLFTGDTVFAGGTLSAIGPSGNISDYMNSIERLTTLRIEEIHPGHGKASITPDADMRQALEYALSLFEDSKLLYEAMASRKPTGAQ